VDQLASIAMLLRHFERDGRRAGSFEPF